MINNSILVSVMSFIFLNLIIYTTNSSDISCISTGGIYDVDSSYGNGPCDTGDLYGYNGGNIIINTSLVTFGFNSQGSFGTTTILHSPYYTSYLKNKYQSELTEGYRYDMHRWATAWVDAGLDSQDINDISSLFS